MVCVYCGTDTDVINSRPQKRRNSVWRRRHCDNCQAVFTTIEQADLSGALRIQRNTKAFEPFVRDKLFLSIYKSCSHRPTAISDASALTTTVISRLMASTPPSTAINPITIVNIATVVLQRFDKSAAVHYAAFHPSTP